MQDNESGDHIVCMMTIWGHEQSAGWNQWFPIYQDFYITRCGLDRCKD